MQKKDAAGEAAAVDGSAAATNGTMDIDVPATTAEPAVNGTATAEKKKKKKKRTAEEAALEAAPAEAVAAAAEDAPKKKKKKEKAAVNGVADTPTTEKKVQRSHTLIMTEKSMLLAYPSYRVESSTATGHRRNLCSMSTAHVAKANRLNLCHTVSRA